MRLPSLIIAILTALLPLSLAVSSSGNYQISAQATSGSDNVSSATYRQIVGVGIIGSLLSSSTYLNKLGFFNTVLLANGQPCATASQCQGGFCCSSSCASSSCPSGGSGSSSSGGGGGGGGAAGGYSGGGGGGGLTASSAIQPLPTFSIAPDPIHFSLTLGSQNSSTIKVTNRWERSLNGTASILTVGDFISLDIGTLTNLGSGESATLTLNALGRRLGSHFGILSVSLGGVTKTADLLIDVESDQVLFDVKMDISPSYKTLSQREPLRAQITLFNVGVGRRVDVMVTYLIKDTTGRVVSEESETFAVLGEKSYAHQFQLSKLPPGKYLAAVEVRYENAFAVSSDIFSVAEGEPRILAEIAKSNTTFFLALLALSLVLFVALTYIIRLRKRRKKGVGQKPTRMGR